MSDKSKKNDLFLPTLEQVPGSVTLVRVSARSGFGVLKLREVGEVVSAAAARVHDRLVKMAAESGDPIGLRDMGFDVADAALIDLALCCTWAHLDSFAREDGIEAIMRPVWQQLAESGSKRAADYLAQLKSTQEQLERRDRAARLALEKLSECGKRLFEKAQALESARVAADQLGSELKSARDSVARLNHAAASAEAESADRWAKLEEARAEILRLKAQLAAQAKGTAN